MGTVHHLLVCLLMVVTGFYDVQGARLLVFVTPIVELGSCSFCIWCLYQYRTLYMVTMTLSNIVWIAVATACTFLNALTSLQLGLWFIGVSMACARQIVMF